MLLLCFRRLKSFASQLLARVDLSIWHFIRINRLLSPFVHVLFEATGMSISSTTAAGGLTSGVATGLPQAYSIASGKEMEAGKYLVRARRVQIVSFRKLGVPYFGVLITILGTIFGSPIFGNFQIFAQVRTPSHTGSSPNHVGLPPAVPRRAALPQRGQEEAPMAPWHHL